MAIFQSLEFDGINSMDYGIYITGQAVYNSPERSVEMVTIPGRNGSFVLDKGRFENIEVTYHAGAFARTQEEFANKIARFRNMIASKVGYKRLVDTYNQEEYRMAVFKNVIDVSAVAMSSAGEFDIVFDCKPQRFLMSGESRLSVTSGQSIFNPTPFASSPLLAVNGYGDIGIGGKTVTVADDTIGEVALTRGSTRSDSVTLSTTNLNSGDSIYMKDSPMFYADVRSVSGSLTIEITNYSSNVLNAYAFKQGYNKYYLQIETNPSWYQSFKKGSQLASSSSINVTISGSDIATTSGTVLVSLEYNGANTMTASLTTRDLPTSALTVNPSYFQPIYYGNSTKLANPRPLYVDLDIGETYGEVGGEIIPLNSIVTLPVELPTLASGSNMITKSNTITSLEITPRWWKV